MSEEVPSVEAPQAPESPAPEQFPQEPVPFAQYGQGEPELPPVVPEVTPEPVAAAPTTPPHGTAIDTANRFCRCPDCESARRGYRV